MSRSNISSAGPVATTGRAARWLVVSGGGPAEPPSALAQVAAVPGLALYCGAEGRRPSAATLGRRSAVVAGELHNRGDLLELVAGGPPPGDDASLILAAYERLGEGLFDRLRGAFSVVVWDDEREVLLAARDHVGLRPLFYARVGDGLLIADSVELLIGQPGVSATLNRPMIADHLRHRWLVKEETHYERVERVPPGHFLRSDRGATRLVRYWSPRPPRPGEPWNEEDELERFGFLLDQAVQRALAYGPAGIYLSGGLDSVSVAAIATDDSPAAGLPSPVALSLVFPDPRCNEEDVQRRVAESLGLPLVLVDFDTAVGPRGLIPAALDLTRSRAIPLLNVWSPAYRHLGNEASRLGCRAILTGMGGDEWLCVSPFYGVDLLRAGDLAGFYRLWSIADRSHRFTRLEVFRAAAWTFGLRPLLGLAFRTWVRRAAPGLYAARMRRLMTMPDWLAPDRALRRDLADRTQLYLDQLYDGKASFYEHECRTGLDHPLVSLEYEELYEDGVALGVELQHPYLDVDLVEFLYRAQPEVLNRGDRSKGMVRETLARRFPSLGFERQKKVSAIEFFSNAALEQAPKAWEQMGGLRALGDLGIVDTGRLGPAGEGITSPHMARRAGCLWDMVNIEAWVRSRTCSTL
jgi:asparagine synthase (glutamine-hydrolysing)